MGTNQIAGRHGRWNLAGAMGDGTWNGYKSNCRRPWAMESWMGTNKIASGHWRWNMGWGQIRRPQAMKLGMGTNQIACGRGRWNLEWGQIKMQAAMGDGTCNGDNSNCMWFSTTLERQPLKLQISAQAAAAGSSERRWGSSSQGRPRLALKLWPILSPKCAQAVVGNVIG